jgi:hypothetical protein
MDDFLITLAIFIVVMIAWDLIKQALVKKKQAPPAPIDRREQALRDRQELNKAWLRQEARK